MVKTLSAFLITLVAALLLNVALVSRHYDQKPRPYEPERITSGDIVQLSVQELLPLEINPIFEPSTRRQQPTQ